MKVETTAAVSDPPSAVSAAVTGELAALVAFCQAHGSPCFVGWPPEILARWLCFHAEHGSLAVVKTPAGEVAGLWVGWQCQLSELERRWHVTDPAGDCFYFAHCIVTQRKAMAVLFLEFARRIPRWSELKLFARRRHIADVFKRGLPPGVPAGICQYPPRLLQRLYERAL